METKHTPGEWSAHHFVVFEPDDAGKMKQGEKMKRSVFAHNNDEQGRRCTQVLADVFEQAGHPEQAEANAHIIAAAPKLLASCVAMMKYMEDGFLVRNASNDASSDWALKALSFVKDMQTMHAAIAKAEGEIT